MPCDVCRHTVQNLGIDGAGRRVFWCDRCGAVVTDKEMSDGSLWRENQAPKLVVIVNTIIKEFTGWNDDLSSELELMAPRLAKAIRDAKEALGEIA